MIARYDMSMCVTCALFEGAGDRAGSFSYVIDSLHVTRL